MMMNVRTKNPAVGTASARVTQYETSSIAYISPMRAPSGRSVVQSCKTALDVLLTRYGAVAVCQPRNDGAGVRGWVLSAVWGMVRLDREEPRVSQGRLNARDSI